MLQAVARLAITAPRRIIAVALLVLTAAAVFGAPVVGDLSNGGFRDPTSESWRASHLLATTHGQGDMHVVIAVTGDDGVHSAAARAAAADIVATLTRLPYVTAVQSAWTAPPAAAHALVSRNGNTGLIVAGVSGGESAAQSHARELSELLPHPDGVTVRAGGDVMGYLQIVDQTKKDLLVMEAIAVPVSFAVLVWVFGGLLAAALPLTVGVFAVVGSMSALRVLTYVTEVSVFALNLSLALGLALAIDYTLLIVSRFRDELAAGAGKDDALARTMGTAGRTVLFSATTVSLSMIALALFPMNFLRSFAYAGVAVVVFAAAASMLVTPAVIVLLGPRLDSCDVRSAVRRLRGRPAPLPLPAEATFWYRWSKTVMRRAIPIGLAVVALLLVAGAPFLGVAFGYPDDRLLPASASARQVGDELREGFAVNTLTDVTVVLPDVTGVSAADLTRYAADLSRVPGVSAVSSPAGAFVGGAPAGPPSSATGLSNGSAFLTVNSTAPLYTPESEQQLDDIHAVPVPDGSQALMTGWAQINRDSADAVTSRLPYVLAIIGAVSFVLLFVLSGSLVLPLKALLLNVLSLTAAFGALVWVFQDGHLGAFGTTPTGTVVASVPVLLFCLVFGLSMDYEVFLISRIREFWLASGQTRADNENSVALGLAHTGRVVTAAAVLMAVTFSALIAAHVSIMRMFGVGVTLAVLVDATLVRMVLLPASMKVLGRLNWWAPQPWRAVGRRAECTVAAHVSRVSP